MEKFVVSARKYRPQNFSTVVGQRHITTTLKNAIKNGQLAHAFLFCGPRGVGKTTCARILAKTINCTNPTPDGEACNACASCLSFNEGTSLNIHELDAASNNSVDDIRTLVEQIRFTPQAGKYKVYIIDEVHMLSSSAFNAFLKTLEEPPAYAIFILATTEKHKILPTILSRCQIFDFKRITLSDTVKHLAEICEVESITAQPDALQVIAQKSEGCMRDALSILDKIVSFTNGEVTYQNTLEQLNILDDEYYFKLVEAMLNQKLADALLLYDDINRKGFEGDLVVNGLSEFLRNLLICKDEKVARLLEVVESYREKYAEVAASTDGEYLVTALNVLNETEINYKAARNKRLHVELALIKLCYLRQVLDLTKYSDVAGRKKPAEPVRPVSFRIIRPIEIAQQKPATKRSRPPTVESDSPKLIIEEERPAPPPVRDSEPVLVEAHKPAVATMGALNKIREQLANRKVAAGGEVSKPLDHETLLETWNQYTAQLVQAKSSAAKSFELAELVIKNETLVEIISNNSLEQKFIEQEKRSFSDFIQKGFNNKKLVFSVSVRESAAQAEKEPLILSKRDQYEKIIEKYPLVEELRNRLRLELDY
ncbi:MAG TPA: DNA polymerase III subunit gamma/tau [Puia sp.]|nr:DNA polymerase III subunit gamma/tau [Puia sp.]